MGIRLYSFVALRRSIISDLSYITGENALLQLLLLDAFRDFNRFGKTREKIVFLYLLCPQKVK